MKRIAIFAIIVLMIFSCTSIQDLDKELGLINTNQTISHLILVNSPVANSINLPPFVVTGIADSHFSSVTVFGANVPKSAPVMNLTWNFTFQRGEIGEGWQTLVIDGRDMLNQTLGTNTIRIFVTNDTVIPTVNIESPESSQTIGSSTVTVSGTATDNGTYQSGVSDIYISTDGGNFIRATGTVNWSYSTSGLSDGSHTVRAFCIDNYDNISLTNSVTFTVDTTVPDLTKPGVTITEPTSGERYDVSNVTISGTANDSGTVVSGVSAVMVSLNSTTQFDTADGTTSWSLDFDGLNDGGYVLRVYAIDNAGNVSGTNQLFFFVSARDSGVPSVSITSPVQGSTQYGESVNMIGTAADVGEITTGISAVYAAVDSTSAFTVATGTTSWSKAFNSLTAGSHTLYAYAVDGAGYHSATNSVTFTLDDGDHTAPNITVTYPSSGQYITNSNITVIGTASDADSGIAAVYASVNCPTCAGLATGTTSWSRNFDVAPGYNILYYFAVDNAGNSSSTNSRGFTIIEEPEPFTNETGAGTYYDGVNTSLSGNAFKSELRGLIRTHTTLSYTAVWSVYDESDLKPNGKIWDMYSDIPDGAEPYEYSYSSDQCGNYSGEGSCYNREHSWPKSWFDDDSPMYTDVHHLVPTDGYVNGRRSNYPFGEVGSASWTSMNGSKLGSCSTPGYSGTVFEPIDEYKGDFARIYFYMSTCYYGEMPTGHGQGMTDGSDILSWAETMLRRWHEDDPVSQKEIDRNNAIHTAQGNRNPFVDHPEWVDKITDF